MRILYAVAGGSALQQIYPCPSCGLPLEQRRHAAGLSWVCGGCAGVAITFAVIRQHAAVGLADRIWQAARAAQNQSARSCPGCRRAFAVFDVEDVNGTTELDACLVCRFFWFDSTELARLGIVLRRAPAHDRPSPEARRAITKLQLETLREKQEADELADTIRDLLRGWDFWF